MPNLDHRTDRHRIGKARLLRRQGKTYEEIRALIGPVRDEQLAGWLKGIPRPPGTLRARAKDEMRRECRRLRSTGLTYDDIAELTGASAGSLSVWPRNMPREFPGSRTQRIARFQATCARKRAVRLATRAGQITRVAQTVGPVSDRELFLVGLALYWAEGAKSKPWRHNDRVTFINSDANVIRVFMRWLAMVGMGRQRCRFRVSIHQSADIAAAEEYWAGVVGVEIGSLSRTTIKRHNPTTIRQNTAEHYHGCLTVDVAMSAELYRNVEGWWQGLVDGSRERGDGDAHWSLDPPWGNWQSRRPLEP